MDNNTDVQIGNFLAVAAFPFIVGLVMWLLLAVVAGIVAPEGRRLISFVCTLFFLGPLGLHAALVSNYRRD
jgi:hypothetical protein